MFLNHSSPPSLNVPVGHVTFLLLGFLSSRLSDVITLAHLPLRFLIAIVLTKGFFKVFFFRANTPAALRVGASVWGGRRRRPPSPSDSLSSREEGRPEPSAA